MERIVIIDHETHRLYIEDVHDEVLAKYNGEEEDYIKDTYDLSDNWSWDFVANTLYTRTTPDEEETISLDFNLMQ